MFQVSFKSLRAGKTLRRKTLTAAAVICLSSMVVREAQAEPASCPSPIPFGLTAALTGTLALLGTQARDGAEFAIDEINANGGIAGNRLALTTEERAEPPQ